VNYFRIIDLWDDQEQDWTSAEFAKSRKWIKTAPQMRDYKEIIHIINSQRPEWLTTLRGDDPPPAIGSWWCEVGLEANAAGDLEAINLIKVSACTQTHMKGTEHAVKDDKRVRMLSGEPHETHIDLLVEAAVVSWQGNDCFCGTKSEANIMHGRMEWGEGRDLMPMTKFTVKALRNLICNQHQTQVSSLEHWQHRHPHMHFPWSKIWKSLSNTQVDKRHASRCLKLLHLIKRTKYATRLCPCPHPSCSSRGATADYVHSLCKCPIALRIWVQVADWYVNITGHSRPQIATANILTGLPTILNQNTPKAPLVWTIIHTVTLNAMWVAWCSHTHERDVFAHSAVMAKVKKALTIRLQELWNKAKRLTRESPHLIPTPIDSFRITWCTGMITTTHCNKLKIDYAHKRTPERRNNHHRQTPPAQNH
jgi:hypothetical protein